MNEKVLDHDSTDDEDEQLLLELLNSGREQCLEKSSTASVDLPLEVRLNRDAIMKQQEKQALMQDLTCIGKSFLESLHTLYHFVVRNEKVIEDCKELQKMLLELVDTEYHYRKDQTQTATTQFPKKRKKDRSNLNAITKYLTVFRREDIYKYRSGALPVTNLTLSFAAKQGDLDFLMWAIKNGHEKAFDPTVMREARDSNQQEIIKWLEAQLQLENILEIQQAGKR